MNNQLKKATEEWMQLERKTLEQRKIADDFYETNLMGLIIKDYHKRNKCRVYERVDYLILSVGTSYEPLLLNLTLFKPKKILFLYTEKTESTLEKVVSYCELKASAYHKEKVDETNPLTIYKEIKASYLSWKKPEKIYIDFTGGTKAMSAAAAMAGALIQVQLIYVGTKNYLADMRKPEPGSEELVYIDNPISVFGDLEIEKAMVLFEQHNYTGAKEKLSVLMKTVPDPGIRQQLEFACLVAKAYEAWDSLEFPAAEKYMAELVAGLKRDRMVNSEFLLMDFIGKFDVQHSVLDKLCCISGKMKEEEFKAMLSDGEIMAALIFSLFQNAMVREQQEKYDMAALLFYRILEMMEQRRLIHFNLYASRMDYANMTHPGGKCFTGDELNALKKRFAGIKASLFSRPSNPYLPDQISLLEGYILLLALDDPISRSDHGRDLDFIKRLRSMVYLRNNSIFAHGLGPVGKGNYIQFRDFSITVLQKFCKLEDIFFRQYMDDIQWVNPMESRYYTGMET